MKVAVVMGSDSDYPVMKAAVDLLNEFAVECEAKVLSAHRTPEDMILFGKEAKEKGFSIVIAGAGGAAHLPGMLASVSSIPIIGVPVQLKTLDGMDSLLSIVQMPKGVPVATVAINNSMNAALLALRILATSNSDIYARLEEFRYKQANESRAKRLE
ncbi:MAG: 5-(carboxyamino)imidazole ribonucleotide mutase [Bdellovibrionota bacterium]|nr:5-(carboxyamino)imidazole ribonucleotide mutase [Bdellovibrionota bacterium]